MYRITSQSIKLKSLYKFFTPFLLFLSGHSYVKYLSAEVSEFKLPSDDKAIQSLLLKQFNFIDFTGKSQFERQFSNEEKLEIAKQRYQQITKPLFSQFDLPHVKASYDFSKVWFEAFDFIQYFFDPNQKRPNIHFKIGSNKFCKISTLAYFNLNYPNSVFICPQTLELESIDMIVSAMIHELVHVWQHATNKHLTHYSSEQQATHIQILIALLAEQYINESAYTFKEEYAVMTMGDLYKEFLHQTKIPRHFLIEQNQHVEINYSQELMNVFSEVMLNMSTDYIVMSSDTNTSQYFLDVSFSLRAKNDYTWDSRQSLAEKHDCSIRETLPNASCVKLTMAAGPVKSMIVQSSKSLPPLYKHVESLLLGKLKFNLQQ